MLAQLDASVELSNEFFVGYCGINVNHFSITMDWMTEIGHYLKVSSTALSLAYQILNTYFATLDEDRTSEQLQLTASAALSLASCLCSDVPVTDEDLVHTSINGFTLLQLQETIRKVAITLSGKLLLPNHIAFLNQLYLTEHIEPNDRRAVIELLQLVCMRNETYQYKPIRITVAAIFLVQLTRGYPIDTLGLIVEESGTNYRYRAKYMLPLINHIYRLAKAIVIPRLHSRKRHSNITPLLSLYKRIDHDLVLEDDVRYIVQLPVGQPVNIIRSKHEQVLGKGGYGKVFIATVNKTKVAVKEQTNRCTTLLEIAIMATLAHNNVQSLKGFSINGGNYEVMVIQKASLHHLIYAHHTYQQGLDQSNDIWRPKHGCINSNFRVIDLLTRRRYARQLLQGLVYLHANGIIHADLKPPNILISHSNTLKIADFGLAFPYVPSVNDYSERTAVVATLPYRDVNILRATVSGKGVARYSFDLDIWSTAVLLMEMETGSVPFDYDSYDAIYFGESPVTGKGGSTQSTLKLIEHTLGEYHNRTIPDLNTSLPAIEHVPFRHLLLQMLEYDNTRRVTAKQALDIL